MEIYKRKRLKTRPAVLKEIYKRYQIKNSSLAPLAEKFKILAPS